MKQLLISFLLLTISSASVAAGWVDAGRVTVVNAGDHGTGVMYFETEHIIHSSTCMGTNGYVYYHDNPTTNRIYTLLLSAYTADKSIEIFLPDEPCHSASNRPRVEAVRYKRTLD